MNEWPKAAPANLMLKAASGGEFRRGESIEGLQVAYNVRSLLVTPLR